MPSFNRISFNNRWGLTLAFWLITFFTFGQNDFIIAGKFKVDGGSNSGAKIIIEKNGKQVKQMEGESRFEIGLDFQAIYVISFQKEGFVTKRLRFDTNVPEDRIEYGFEPFGFTVEIFEQYDDVSMVVFNQPVGRIAYSELIDEFDYDTDYTKSIQSQIDKAMEDVEVAKEKKAEQQEQVGKELANLTKQAESSAKSGNFDEAITALEQAQKLKKDPVIEKRIEELKKTKQEAGKKQEFEGVLEKAEAALAAGDLDEAKRLLKQADGVISGDSRVKDQLAQIEKTEKAKAQQEKAFDDAMDQGEKALTGGDPATAALKAEEALKVKPKDSKAEQLLAAAKKAIEAEEAKIAAAAQEEEKFQALLAEAKKAQDKGDLDVALAKLEEAKSIKADPSLDQQMKSVKDAVAQMEQEKRKAEEAKSKMDALIKEAESALASGDVEGAKSKMAEAVALGEDKRMSEIADRIAAEEKKLAEQAQAEKQKEAEITKALDEANKALAAGALDDAKAKFTAAGELGADQKKVAEGLAKVEAKQEELAAVEAEKAKAQSAKKEKLNALIDQTTAALAKGDLDGARKSLLEAKAVGEDDRLGDLEKQIDAKAKEIAKASEAEAERKAKYESLITEGQTALNAKELDKAKKAFEEARSLVDDPKEAETGLADLQSIRDELSEIQRENEAKAAAAEAAAEKQAQFESAKSAGDKAFEKEKWEEAKTKYGEALAIKEDEAARAQLNAVEAKMEALAAAEAAAEGAELAALEAERKAREEEAAKKAADEEAAKKAAEEEAAKKAAEEAAVKKAAEMEAAKKSAEEAAQKAAEEEAAAKKAAEEAARKAEEELASQPPKENDDTAKRAEEAAAAAAKKAKEAEAKRLEAIEKKRSDAAAFLQANKLDRAQSAYEELLALAPNDADAKNKLDQITGLKEKLAAQKEETENAAVAIADQRGRESEQLAEIIEQESVKEGAQEIADPDPTESKAASPSVNTVNQSESMAKAVMEQDVRPGAPEGPIIISNQKVGDEALKTKTAQLTDDEKYDGMLDRTEEQQQEFYRDQEQQALMEKYTSRKTIEIDTVGNSVVTKVFINTGEFVTIFKKVEHNWGGVYFFVDEQSTNRRFWEHETQ